MKTDLLLIFVTTVQESREEFLVTLLQMFWLQKQRDLSFDFSMTGRILLWVFLNGPAAEVKAQPSKLELVVLACHHVSTSPWVCLLAWGNSFAISSEFSSTGFTSCY